MNTGRTARGKTARRSAARRTPWSMVAGTAWLIGFAQYALSVVVSNLDLGPLLFGMAIYGAWALGLGVLLLSRPTPTRLLVSLAFALVVIVVYWPFPALPSFEWPLLLSWLPEAVAAAASAIGWVATRQPAGEAKAVTGRGS